MNPPCRPFVIIAGMAPLAFAASRAFAEPAACYNPEALPLSQKNTCQLLTGGPVNAGGVCNSFAVKGA